jgi:alpha-L-fucosidase
MKEYLKRIDEVIANGKYQDTWESLQQYEVPLWYQKARIGIFIHWGVYSVPAFGNEWYARDMYIQGNKVYEHHRKTYGNQKELDTRILSRCSRQKNLTQRSGSSCFRRLGQNM